MKKNVFKKSMAMLLIALQLAGLMPSDAQAAEKRDISWASLIPVDTLQVSAELGRVQTRIQGKLPKTLLLIEDAHAVPAAQKSVWKLIETLHGQYGSFPLLLEGVTEAPKLALEHSFPDRDWLTSQIESDIQEQNISGAAAALILAPQLNAQSAESKKLYIQAVRLYQEAQGEQEDVLAKLERARDVVVKAKEKVYPRAAFKWNRLIESDSLDGLKIVFESGQKENFDNYKHLQSVREMVRRQQFLKRPAVVRFWSQFLSKLEQSAQSSQRQSLAALKEEFRQNRVSLSDSAEKLKEFLSAEEVSKATKLEQQLYRLALRAAEEWRGINAAELHEQYRAFLIQKTESFFTKSAQRLLLKQTLRIQLLKKLVRLELSHSEWKQVQKMKLEQPAWNVFKNFYSIQHDREKMMEKQIEKSFRISPSTVFVSGGFHRMGLEKIARDQGWGFVVITPAMKTLEGAERYGDLMRGQVGWRSEMKNERGNIDLQKAYWNYLIRQYAKEKPVQIYDLLLRWRKQLVLRLADLKQLDLAVEIATPLHGWLADFMPEISKQKLRAEWMQRLQNPSAQVQVNALPSSMTQSPFLLPFGRIPLDLLAQSTDDKPQEIEPRLPIIAEESWDQAAESVAADNLFTEKQKRVMGAWKLIRSSFLFDHLIQSNLDNWIHKNLNVFYREYRIYLVGMQKVFALSSLVFIAILAQFIVSSDEPAEFARGTVSGALAFVFGGGIYWLGGVLRNAKELHDFLSEHKIQIENTAREIESLRQSYEGRAARSETRGNDFALNEIKQSVNRGFEAVHRSEARVGRMRKEDLLEKIGEDTPERWSALFHEAGSVVGMAGLLGFSVAATHRNLKRMGLKELEKYHQPFEHFLEAPRFRSLYVKGGGIPEKILQVIHSKLYETEKPKLTLEHLKLKIAENGFHQDASLRAEVEDRLAIKNAFIRNGADIKKTARELFDSDPDQAVGKKIWKSKWRPFALEWRMQRYGLWDDPEFMEEIHAIHREKAKFEVPAIAEVLPQDKTVSADVRVLSAWSRSTEMPDWLFAYLAKPQEGRFPIELVMRNNFMLPLTLPQQFDANGKAGSPRFIFDGYQVSLSEVDWDQTPVPDELVREEMNRDWVASWRKSKAESMTTTVGSDVMERLKRIDEQRAMGLDKRPRFLTRDHIISRLWHRRVNHLSNEATALQKSEIPGEKNNSLYSSVIQWNRKYPERWISLPSMRDGVNRAIEGDYDKSNAEFEGLNRARFRSLVSTLTETVRQGKDLEQEPELLEFAREIAKAMPYYVKQELGEKAARESWPVEVLSFMKSSVEAFGSAGEGASLEHVFFKTMHQDFAPRFKNLKASSSMLSLNEKVFDSNIELGDLMADISAEKSEIDWALLVGQFYGALAQRKIRHIPLERKQEIAEEVGALLQKGRFSIPALVYLSGDWSAMGLLMSESQPLEVTAFSVGSSAAVKRGIESALTESYPGVHVRVVDFSQVIDDEHQSDLILFHEEDPLIFAGGTLPSAEREVRRAFNQDSHLITAELIEAEAEAQMEKISRQILKTPVGRSESRILLSFSDNRPGREENINLNSHQKSLIESYLPGNFSLDYQATRLLEEDNRLQYQIDDKKSEVQDGDVVVFKPKRGVAKRFKESAAVNLTGHYVFQVKNDLFRYFGFKNDPTIRVSGKTQESRGWWSQSELSKAGVVDISQYRQAFYIGMSILEQNGKKAPISLRDSIILSPDLFDFFVIKKITRSEARNSESQPEMDSEFGKQLERNVRSAIFWLGQHSEVYQNWQEKIGLFVRHFSRRGDSEKRKVVAQEMMNLFEAAYLLNERNAKGKPISDAQRKIKVTFAFNIEKEAVEIMGAARVDHEGKVYHHGDLFDELHIDLDRANLLKPMILGTFVGAAPASFAGEIDIAFMGDEFSAERRRVLAMLLLDGGIPSKKKLKLNINGKPQNDVRTLSDLYPRRRSLLNHPDLGPRIREELAGEAVDFVGIYRRKLKIPQHDEIGSKSWLHEDDKFALGVNDAAEKDLSKNKYRPLSRYEIKQYRKALRSQNADYYTAEEVPFYLSLRVYYGLSNAPKPLKAQNPGLYAAALREKYKWKNKTWSRSEVRVNTDAVNVEIRPLRKEQSVTSVLSRSYGFADLMESAYGTGNGSVFELKRINLNDPKTVVVAAANSQNKLVGYFVASPFKSVSSKTFLNPGLTSQDLGGVSEKKVYYVHSTVIHPDFHRSNLLWKMWNAFRAELNRRNISHLLMHVEKGGRVEKAWFARGAVVVESNQVSPLMHLLRMPVNRHTRSEARKAEGKPVSGKNQKIEFAAQKGPLEARIRLLLKEVWSIFNTHQKWQRAIVAFGSARIPPGHRYYAAAERLGAYLVELNLSGRTGAGPSIMEAVLKGMMDAMAKLLRTMQQSLVGMEITMGVQKSAQRQGIRITLPFEKETNGYVELVENYVHFVTRKKALYENSYGAIAFPGGFGTMDEIFEALTRGVPVVLYGKNFWNPMVETLDKIWNQEQIAANLSKILVTDDVEEAVQFLLKKYSQAGTQLTQMTKEHVLRSNREIAREMRRLRQMPRAVTFVGEPPSTSTTLPVSSSLSAYLQSLGISVRVANQELLTYLTADKQPGDNQPKLQAVLLSSPDSKKAPAPQPIPKNRLIALAEQSNHQFLVTGNSYAYVFFPGSDKTMNILFDTLQILQIEYQLQKPPKVKRKPIILVGKKFWQPIKDVLIKQMLEGTDGISTISPEDPSLLIVVDSVADALVEIQKFLPEEAQAQIAKDLKSRDLIATSASDAAARSESRLWRFEDLQLSARPSKFDAVSLAETLSKFGAKNQDAVLIPRDFELMLPDRFFQGTGDGREFRFAVVEADANGVMREHFETVRVSYAGGRFSLATNGSEPEAFLNGQTEEAVYLRGYGPNEIGFERANGDETLVELKSFPNPKANYIAIKPFRWGDGIKVNVSELAGLTRSIYQRSEAREGESRPELIQQKNKSEWLEKSGDIAFAFKTFFGFTFWGVILGVVFVAAAVVFTTGALIFKIFQAYSDFRDADHEYKITFEKYSELSLKEKQKAVEFSREWAVRIPPYAWLAYVSSKGKITGKYGKPELAAVQAYDSLLSGTSGRVRTTGLFVAKKWRRQGLKLATRLRDRFFSDMKVRGISEVWIEVDPSEEAQAFHRNQQKRYGERVFIEGLRGRNYLMRLDGFQPLPENLADEVKVRIPVRRSEARASKSKMTISEQADALRLKIIRSLPNVRSDALSEELAHQEITRFAQAVRGAPEMENYFDHSYFTAMRDNAKDARHTLYSLKPGKLMLEMVSVPVLPGNVYGVTFFNLIDLKDASDRGTPVAYAIYQIFKDKDGIKTHSINAAFNVFKAYRDHSTSKYAFKTHDLYNAWLAGLVSRNPVHIRVDAESQITQSRLGDLYLRVLFNLSRGYYPPDNKEEADRLFLDIHVHKDVTHKRVDAFLKKTKAQHWILPVQDLKQSGSAKRSEARDNLNEINTILEGMNYSLSDLRTFKDAVMDAFEDSRIKKRELKEYMSLILAAAVRLYILGRPAEAFAYEVAEELARSGQPVDLKRILKNIRRTQRIYGPFARIEPGYVRADMSSLLRVESLRRYVVDKIGEKSRGGKLLSVGVGIGILEDALIKRYQVEVTGTDVLPEFLQIINQSEGVRSRIRTVVAHGELLPFAKQSYDTVIYPESIGHLDLKSAVQDAARVLKPDGNIFIMTYPPKSKLAEEFQYNQFSKSEIEEALADSGFKDIAFEMTDRKKDYWVISAVKLQRSETRTSVHPKKFMGINDRQLSETEEAALLSEMKKQGPLPIVESPPAAEVERVFRLFESDAKVTQDDLEVIVRQAVYESWEALLKHAGPYMGETASWSIHNGKWASDQYPATHLAGIQFRNSILYLSADFMVGWCTSSSLSFHRSLYSLSAGKIKSSIHGTSLVFGGYLRHVVQVVQYPGLQPIYIDVTGRQLESHAMYRDIDATPGARPLFNELFEKGYVRLTPENAEKIGLVFRRGQAREEGSDHDVLTKFRTLQTGYTSHDYTPLQEYDHEYFHAMTPEIARERRVLDEAYAPELDRDFSGEKITGMWPLNPVVQVVEQVVEKMVRGELTAANLNQNKKTIDWAMELKDWRIPIMLSGFFGVVVSVLSLVINGVTLLRLIPLAMSAFGFTALGVPFLIKIKNLYRSGGAFDSEFNQSDSSLHPTDSNDRSEMRNMSLSVADQWFFNLLREVSKPIFAERYSILLGGLPSIWKKTKEGIFVPSPMDEVIQALKPIVTSEHDFIDLGSGLNTSLIAAAHLGAHKAVGIEGDESLFADGKVLIDRFTAEFGRQKMRFSTSSKYAFEKIAVIKGNFLDASRTNLITLNGKVEPGRKRIYYYFAGGSTGLENIKHRNQLLERIENVPAGSYFVLYGAQPDMKGELNVEMLKKKFGEPLVMMFPNGSGTNTYIFNIGRSEMRLNWQPLKESLIGQINADNQPIAFWLKNVKVGSQLPQFKVQVYRTPLEGYKFEVFDEGNKRLGDGAFLYDREEKILRVQEFFPIGQDSSSIFAQYQRQGIGSTLVAWLMAEARLAKFFFANSLDGTRNEHLTQIYKSYLDKPLETRALDKQSRISGLPKSDFESVQVVIIDNPFRSESRTKITTDDLSGWIEGLDQLMRSEQDQSLAFQQLTSQIRERLDSVEKRLFDEQANTFDHRWAGHSDVSAKEQAEFKTFLALAFAILASEQPSLSVLRKADEVIELFNLKYTNRHWGLSLTLVMQLATNHAVVGDELKKQMHLAGKGIRLPGEYKYKMAAFTLYLLGMHVKSLIVDGPFEEEKVDFFPRLSLPLALEVLRNDIAAPDVPVQMRNGLIQNLKVGLTMYLVGTLRFWKHGSLESWMKARYSEASFESIRPLHDWIFENKSELANIANEVETLSRESDVNVIQPGIAWVFDEVLNPRDAVIGTALSWDFVLLNPFSVVAKELFLHFFLHQTAKSNFAPEVIRRALESKRKALSFNDWAEKDFASLISNLETIQLSRSEIRLTSPRQMRRSRQQTTDNRPQTLATYEVRFQEWLKDQMEADTERMVALAQRVEPARAQAEFEKEMDDLRQATVNGSMVKAAPVIFYSPDIHDDLLDLVKGLRDAFQTRPNLLNLAIVFPSNETKRGFETALGKVGANIHLLEQNAESLIRLNRMIENKEWRGVVSVFFAPQFFVAGLKPEFKLRAVDAPMLLQHTVMPAIPRLIRYFSSASVVNAQTLAAGLPEFAGHMRYEAETGWTLLDSILSAFSVVQKTFAIAA